MVQQGIVDIEGRGLHRPFGVQGYFHLRGDYRCGKSRMLRLRFRMIQQGLVDILGRGLSWPFGFPGYFHSEGHDNAMETPNKD